MMVQIVNSLSANMEMEVQWHHYICLAMMITIPSCIQAILLASICEQN